MGNVLDKCCTPFESEYPSEAQMKVVRASEGITIPKHSILKN